MAGNIIQVQNLTKMYKLYARKADRLRDSLGLAKGKCLYTEHYALRDVSFAVEEGECVGIIGVNGSGKSTLLKIITGVLAATGGLVQVDGRISALLELGAGFNMEYTGIENIYLNGTMQGFSRKEIEARMEEILRFADIGDYVHQPVKTYSSGMFVRLAFAMAINIDPEILIVDEALSVGDVFFQAKCYHKFDEFKKAGKTILFVSHDLSSVAKYCDRVILLHKGEKLDEGTPKAMVDEYKQLLVGQEPVKVTGNGKMGAPGETEGDHPAEELTPGTEEEKEGAAASLEEKETGKEREEADGAGLHLSFNPEILEYGKKEAEITEIEIFDDKGMLTDTIEKGKRFCIRVHVRFHEDIQEPIVAYTIKNIKGTEITGTNTMFEGADPIPGKAGSSCTVSFTQIMNLQGGEYLISFGCTGYRNGDFAVYHRLYDAVNLSVIAQQNTVGFYDMFSEVQIQSS